MTASPNPQPALPANLAVLRGVVHRPPVERRLPSGARVLQFDVATDGAGGLTSPVAVHDDTTHLDEGDQVVVVGRVVRRFFRAGGSTASRTEVVASEVIRATKRPSTERAVWRAIERLSATPA